MPAALFPHACAARGRRCDGSTLEKATLSDHGGVIIGMYHEADAGGGDSAVEAKDFCDARETAGFNSGMGVRVPSLHPEGRCGATMCTKPIACAFSLFRRSSSARSHQSIR